MHQEGKTAHAISVLALLLLASSKGKTLQVITEGDDGEQALQAVATLIRNGFDEDELYDLAADPHELHNLAADPTQRPLLENLAASMWAIIRQTDDFNMAEAQYGMFRFAPVGPEPLNIEENNVR